VDRVGQRAPYVQPQGSGCPRLMRIQPLMCQATARLGARSAARIADNRRSTRIIKICPNRWDLTRSLGVGTSKRNGVQGRVAEQQSRATDVRFGSMLLKKSPATGSMAQNGEFQNPKGRVLESKFSTESYFEKSILRAGRQKRFSTVSVKSRHRIGSAPCPLYPRKRTLELGRGMSALRQKRTFCAAVKDVVIR
jgi:hypothetical protein